MISTVTYLNISDQAQHRAGIWVPVEDMVEMQDRKPGQPIPEQHETATTVVGNVLSVTQLFLRRGLVLLVMVVIHVAVIIARHFLVKLLKSVLCWFVTYNYQVNTG